MHKGATVAVPYQTNYILDVTCFTFYAWLAPQIALQRSECASRASRLKQRVTLMSEFVGHIARID